MLLGDVPSWTLNAFGQRPVLEYWWEVTRLAGFISWLIVAVNGLIGRHNPCNTAKYKTGGAWTCKSDPKVKRFTQVFGRLIAPGKSPVSPRYVPGKSPVSPRYVPGKSLIVSLVSQALLSDERIAVLAILRVGRWSGGDTVAEF